MSTAANEGLRVVLDSNVLISAFTREPPGIPFQIWKMAIERRYQLLTSPARVAEIADVLRRIFPWDEQRIGDRTRFLAKTAGRVVPTITLQAVPGDDDDNRILECAIAGKANLNRLRRSPPPELEIYEGIGIVTPADFRRICQREENIRAVSALAAVGW